jgi:hypothetical protein
MIKQMKFEVYSVDLQYAGDAGEYVGDVGAG